jgi:hypothetical protein
MKIIEALDVAHAYAHEWMHYVVARGLGLKARIRVNPKRKTAYTDVWVETKPQAFLVAAAPAVIGTMLLFALELATARLLHDQPSISLLFVWVAWLIGCAHDLGQLVRLMMKPGF